MTFQRAQMRRTEKKIVVLSSLAMMIAAVGYSVGMINALSPSQAISLQDRYAKNLDVILTLSGLNDTTGQIFAFVNAHGIVQTASLNSTRLDMADNTTDGIGQHGFFLQNVTLKSGEQFTTCVVIPSTVKMICVTDNKAPYPRPQFVDISVK